MSFSGLHEIHISKEALKFSAAHMTVFPDGTKEALHGHNYTVQVSLELADISLSKMLSFSYFKKIMKKISSEWDEKVLIPAKCPFLRVISQSEVEIELVLCKKRYIFPAEEVVLLELDNITTETLSAEYGRIFLGQLDSKLLGSSIRAVRVRVEEIPGQGATFSWSS